MKQPMMQRPIRLDELGHAVWRHKYSKTLFVDRMYEWCDVVTVLDEVNGRRVVDTTAFSTFNFADWIPVTVEQMAKVRRNYKEIYEFE